MFLLLPSLACLMRSIAFDVGRNRITVVVSKRKFACAQRLIAAWQSSTFLNGLLLTRSLHMICVAALQTCVSSKLISFLGQWEPSA